jgi:hypothetical protein
MALIENQVTVKYDSSSRVGYRHGRNFINCEGWFDETVPELVCGAKKSTEAFLMVLCHEFCHFRQWKEKSGFCSDSITTTLDDFLSGKKLSKPRIFKCTKAVREMEWDCEKRSVTLMKQYGLSYNMKRMIQRANAYIFFYTALPTLKKWYKTGPSSIKEIVDLMPDEFLPIGAYDALPDGYIDLCRKHCFRFGKETEYAATA